MKTFSQIRRRLRRNRLLRNGRAVAGKFLELGMALPKWRAYRKRVRSQSRPSRNTASRAGGAALHVVFVTAYARARESKLGFTAAAGGHHITLVSAERQFQDQTSRHFAAHYQATTPWQILDVLYELRPDVVHLFVNYNNFDMLPVLRFSPAPVIYDPYDCLRDMFVPRYQKDWVELACERQAFATAAHVCTRSIEPLHLRRHRHYRMSGVTYFPDYCWNEPALRPARVPEGQSLHVVYCGGIWPEDRYSAEEYGYAQHLETGRILARQDIHLHIFPAVPWGLTDFEGFYAAYLNENKSNPHFHFHRPLAYNELIDRLRGFDGALHVSGTEIDKHLGRVTRTKLHYSTANKLFDYIEAGLPVIIHGGRHQAGLVRHYGTAVRVTSLHEARPALEGALRHPRQRRTGATLADHADRLLDMYAKIARGRELDR